MDLAKFCFGSAYVVALLHDAFGVVRGGRARPLRPGPVALASPEVFPRRTGVALLRAGARTGYVMSRRECVCVAWRCVR